MAASCGGSVSCKYFSWTYLCVSGVNTAGECVIDDDCDTGWTCEYTGFCNPSNTQAGSCGSPSSCSVSCPGSPTGNSCDHTESCSCSPGATSCGTCSETCDGGTQTCTDGCSSWSETCNTQACCNTTTPAAPTLASPSNGASYTGVSSVTLTWNAVTAWGEECSGTANRSYEICVGTSSTDPCSGGTTLTTSDPTTPAVTTPYTQNITGTYFWKVKSINKGSASSAWSGTRSFTITNRPPAITPTPPGTNYVTPLEISRTGSATLSYSPHDLDGGADISHVYLAMTNCTSATGDPGWSYFEHNLANWFGAQWRDNGLRALIKNEPLSSCVSGYPSPNAINVWDYTAFPLSNVPGNLTINSINGVVSGNNLNTSWNLTLNNFPVGNHYTYAMIKDKEEYWHTFPNPMSWTRLNQVCAEGGPYIVDTPALTTCGSHVTSCTQDCTTINNCAGYPINSCLECGPYLVDTPALTTCGNHVTTCTEDCGSDNCVGYPLNSCLECGPTVSSWATWSACGVGTHLRTRTRTCTETCTTDNNDCQDYFTSNCPAGSTCATTGSGLSWTQTATQNCTGTVTGTLYDASDADTCAQLTVPINGGGTATFGFAGPWTTIPNPITVSTAGVFSFTAYTPGNYSPNFQNLVDLGLIGSITPKLSCNGGVDVTFSGSATGCLTQPCETITGQDYGFYRQYDGWWQANGGPIYAGDSVGSEIPSSYTGNQFLINPITNHKGFLFYGSSYDLGTNPDAIVNASDTHLQGTNESTVVFNYEFFKNKLSSRPSDVTWTTNNLPNYNDVGSKGYMLIKYTGSAGSLTIGAKAIAANQKYIALIPAGVTVNVTGNITIANTGFLALIADGNINFGTSVTAAQGWYLADGSISVSSTGDSTTEQQFVGTGSFVGRTGITFNRDRGVTNNTAPAEVITYSASQLVAAPDVIKFPFKKYTRYRP